uniref:Putative DNA-repair protein n=1 Tax=Trypanosoma vivax (strain Y486) TaxID=1055687 RepID=G0U386_TRYVY|nr:putative DNA-repair protein, fragment [Trypanosoma vivax Y486]
MVPPQMNKLETNTAYTLTAAAAVNVDGYLRNVSSRARVPVPSGGRGTRRRCAMVVAAGDGQAKSDFISECSPAADDEWDEVVLLNTVASAVGMCFNKDKLRHSTRSSLPPVTQWGAHITQRQQMFEQQQLLAAKRRTERMARTAEEVSNLVFALLRGNLIVRESRHPKLVRHLLRFRTAKENTLSSYPFLIAAREAKEHYRRGLNPDLRAPSLTPCWVTANKDGVGNYTSASITTLLRALNSVFGLDHTVESDVLSDWAVTLKPGYLIRKLSIPYPSSVDSGDKILLHHSLYMCVIFLALAHPVGLSCRLVMAIRKRQSQDTPVSLPDGQAQQAVMSIFCSSRKKRQRDTTKEGEEVSRKLPLSCFWLEVWCPQKQSFISVNPTEGCSALFGAPYTFSIGGDVTVDVSPRYTMKYSSAFPYRLGRCDKYRFFWKHIGWNDTREASEIIADCFSRDLTRASREQQARERKQLQSLTYAEEVPKTITALRKHPLFVVESALARFEGIYPKDCTTIVGQVKGQVVFKRFAVVRLRSRDGWLREGLSVVAGAEPYKVIPPPPSRPLGRSCALFGIWQTQPFSPEPLQNDGSIPKHGNTNWYILLDKPPLAGLVHISRPNIARVARRMEVDFGVAVRGFKRRRLNECRVSGWEAVTDGIVVKESDASKVVRAYEEWTRLVEEQEAARRKQRANRLWLHFAQRLLAHLRVRQQYLEGASHGALATV